MMKLKLGFALSLVLGCSSIAKTTIDDGVVRDIYELESLFVEQQYQFLPISPPFEEVYVHSHGIAVPVDWKKFPVEFTKQMFAEMDANGYPIYKISIYEDPATRESVFLNSYGTETYRLPAEKDYDPFLWAKTTFDISSELELGEWERWLWDPAKIAASFTLIPEIFHADYLATQEEQAALEESMVPMGMMMEMGGSVSNLMIGITAETGSNSTVKLELRWPDGFSNELEIYSAESLLSNWIVASGKFPTLGETNLVLSMAPTTPESFFRFGDATTDTDGDFLPDARELVVTRSLIDDPDSDNGQIPDGYEASSGMDPNDPSDETTAAIAAYLAVAGDPDGDGSPDWRETLQETNPHDRFD